MAENETESNSSADQQAGGQQGGDPNAPQAAVMAQYVKDLSFENPRAAQTLQQFSQGQVQPKIEVNINVSANRLGEEAYEVDLKINASSKVGDDTAFAVELVYAGLFGIRNMPDNMLQPFLLVQAPHILFPFARRIVADTVRDGGYSPLMLEPIDFAQLYQRQQQQTQAQAETSGAQALSGIDLGEPQGNA